MTRRAFVATGVAGASTLVGCRAIAKSAARDALRAGAAETVATPDAENTFLIGPMKPSTGVNDDLYARALVFDDGRMKAAIITLDYLGFDFDYTAKLIKVASDASGVPADHIMLNCSHTHSAPLTAPWGPWKEHRDAPFFDMLPKKVAAVSKAAAEALRPATLCCGTAPVQIGFNRRLLHNDRITMAPNPNGAVVPQVAVLAVDGTDGKPIAVLFSYAAHPVIVHGASTLISGDYPGFAVAHVRKKLGDAPCLFLQGCSGNVNGFPLRGGIEAAAAAGRDLGDAVLRALDGDVLPIEVASLRVHGSQLNLPLADPPPLDELKRKHDDERSAERRQRFAELIAIAQREKRPTMAMPVRALVFGEELCILGLAHEPFAEYHHHAIKASPFKRTFVLGYTNGLECYVGTKKDYDLGDRGGYETSPWGAAFMFQSRLPLSSESEALIHRGVAEVLSAAAKKP